MAHQTLPALLSKSRIVGCWATRPQKARGAHFDRQRAAQNIENAFGILQKQSGQDLIGV
jgi:hypothetical protein